MRAGFRIFLVLMLLLGVASAGAEPGLNFGAPKDYVLALGDSLTFGFQRAKFFANPDPSNFNTGFVDDFTARLGATAPGRSTQVVNFGCPLETSASFLTGPCLYHAAGFSLHNNFSGSQIDAAESFLREHPGQVGPILIALGGNDTSVLTETCGVNLNCINTLFPQVLAALVQNYGTILGRLRAAAPEAEILVLGLYNPAAVSLPATNQLVQIINQVIQTLATANRAILVNPFRDVQYRSPSAANAVRFNWSLHSTA